VGTLQVMTTATVVQQFEERPRKNHSYLE